MHYSLARATAWNLAGYLYLIVASLISTPILVRSLGLAVFAQYGLIVATLVLVSSLDLGLPQAVVRSLVREYAVPDKLRSIWATSSNLFIITGIFSGLLAVLIVSRFTNQPLILLCVFALALMTSLVSHYATLPQAKGHFGYYNARTFIVGTGSTLLSAYLAWSGLTVLQLLLGSLVCYLLTLLILVYFSLKFFPHPQGGRYDSSIARSLLSFGFKNQVGKIVGQVQSQYAKYLLASVPATSLSAYMIASGLVTKLAGGVAQLSTAFYPASARATKTDILPLYYRLQFSILGLTLLGITAFYLWGLSFLQWWLGLNELVAVVYPLLQILIWYFAILVLTPLCSTVLDSRGRPEITSAFASATTLIEIVLALSMYPRFGVYAPVYASIIAVAITTPYLLYITDQIIRVKSTI